MNTRSNVFLAALIAVAVAATPSSVSAQSAPARPEAGEVGITFGGLRFIPSLTVMAQWDTNANNRPSNVPNRVGFTEVLGATGDLILRPNIGFRLIYPSRKVNFAFGGLFQYNYFAGVNEKTLRTFDESGAVVSSRKVSTNDLSAPSANANLALTILPENAFSVVLRDDFFFTQLPENNPLAFNIMNRLGNRAQIDLRYQPNGAEGTLRFTARYINDYSFFLEKAFRGLNSLRHQAQVHAEYFFLPRTAIFGIVGLDAQDFFDFKRGGVTVVDPSYIGFRADFGLIGQVTNTLAVNASLNYQVFPQNRGLNSYYLPGGRAEITWQAADRTQLQVGFSREAAAVLVYGNLVQNMFYLNFRQWLLQDRLRLGLSATADIQQFGEITDLVRSSLTAVNAQVSNRTDTVLAIAPYIRYLAFEWFNVGFSYRYSRRFSDGVIRTNVNTPGVAPFENAFALEKHEAILSLTFAY